MASCSPLPWPISNSSTYVTLCTSCALNTPIEICGNFLLDQHILQTKSNDSKFVYFSPSIDHKTCGSNGVCNGIYGTYHHLCRTNIPSIFLISLHYYVDHANMLYRPLRELVHNDNLLHLNSFWGWKVFFSGINH